MLTEESAQPRREIGYNSPSLPEITEDLFLAGFIATWLCTFVLPIKDTHVRATVLFTASLISKGERVSLAPPVLGRIYRIFKAISNSSSLEVQNTLPWQYIYAWVHIHVRGAFGCLDYPAFFSERSYPMIMQLTRATSTWERERVRLFFFAPHLVADRFSLAHRPEINEFPDGITGMNMVDSVAQQGRYTLLARGRSFKIAEYFISMRPGWLCYRSGSLVILEKYNPNRVARQFGFSQATAYHDLLSLPGIIDGDKISSVPLVARMHAASMTWAHLLRLGTNSTFRLAPADSRTGVSYIRLTWVRLSFAAFMERGARRYERRVRLLGLPQGQRLRHGITHTDGGRNRGTNDPATMEGIVASPRRHHKEPSPQPTTAPHSAGKRRRSYSTEFSAEERLAEPTTSRNPEIKGASVHTEENFISEAATSPTAEMPVEDATLGITTPAVDAMYSSALSLVPCPDTTYSTGESVHSMASIAPSPAESSANFTMTPDSITISTPLGNSAHSISIPLVPEYQSEIHCRVPSVADSRNQMMHYHNLGFLRDLISRVDPGSPESLQQFTADANRILDYLAYFGMEETELRFWESLCRGVEFLVKRILSLSIIHTRPSFIDLQEQVRLRQEAAKLAHDVCDKSAEAVWQRHQGSSGTKAELDELSVKIQKLQEELAGLTIRKADLQTEYEKQTQELEQEQLQYDVCCRTMIEADAALAQAVESVQIANAEFQTLNSIIAQLRILQSQLP